MKINIYNETKTDIKEYKKVLKKIFRKERNRNSMEIVFVDNEKIHEMNQYYRQIDRPTDVLSFPNEDKETKSLGDIFISVDKIIEQATDYGHSIIREVSFLAVHGYLHLLGFDHETKEEEIEMFTIQEDILKKAKIERGNANEKQN